VAIQLNLLTSLVDFLNMALSLWIAVYIFSRGRNNRITFRAVIVLLAMAFYFLNAFTFVYNPTNWRLSTGALLVAVVAMHNLTYLLLPERLQKKFDWAPRVVFGLGVITAFILVASPNFPEESNYFIQPPNSSAWSIVIDAYFIFASLATIYNLYLIIRIGYRPLNFSFYLALFFGISVIGYVAFGALFNIALPRLVASSMILIGLLLLGFSVAKHQVLIERRTVPYDFAISSFAIVAITILFILVGLQMKLSGFQLVVIAILVITTFSAYDLTRDSILRFYSRREQIKRREVSQMARNATTQNSLQKSLDSILDILCLNLQASGGFIGVKNEGDFLVKATKNSFAFDEQLPKNEVVIEELARPTGLLRLQAAWLAPAFCGGQQMAVIGIGPRSGLKGYTEDDLFWLEDVADHTAKMIYANQRNVSGEPAHLAKTPSDEETLTRLTLKPDPETIKLVEDCLKNLHDYIVLGKSPLADQLAVPGETHIERGKAVHDILVETIKSLRPEGERPGEPLPKEWYNYVIINDAYIEDIRDREIMARLYISEGTYYRTRRKALRGVARALLETEKIGSRDKG
jgi:hypothetical protein